VVVKVGDQEILRLVEPSNVKLDGALVSKMLSLLQMMRLRAKNSRGGIKERKKVVEKESKGMYLE
jgi:arginine repressor